MRYELNFDEDKVNDVLVVGGASYDLKGCCELLNEQQAIIRRDETSIKTMMSNMKKLEEENEQLRKELNDFKPVMFQDVRKGTVILYSKGILMSEKRFSKLSSSIDYFDVWDSVEEKGYTVDEVVELLNEQQATITKLKELNDDKGKRIISLIRTNKTLKEENEQLRLELETHKHPLWSTREAESKVNELVDSLADEVKKNGLLNEELNQLRIENMRLKKKRGDEMS